MEKMAILVGVAGILISIFAMIILYLTRSNIIDLLDRDVVMYDKNYELKKEAIEKAFNCLDMVSQNGVEVKNTAQHVQKAREIYNALLCTVNSAKLYQEFYRLAIDNTASGYSIEDIEKFKISCREELMATKKVKKEIFKGTTSGLLNNKTIQNPIAPQSPIIPQAPITPQAPMQQAVQPRQQAPARQAQPRQQAQTRSQMLDADSGEQ